MILGVEAHFRDAPRGARHRLRGRDHLPLLPEEVDQLEVRRAALGQQVLGVVREGERDDLVTGELRTSGERGPHSIIVKKKHFQKEIKDIRQ